MIAAPLLQWLLPAVVLYAETHYRFRYFFSLLRKREPEVIADAPHRVQPDSPIPILLLVKDADKFPCVVRQVTVTLHAAGRQVQQLALLRDPLNVREKFFWRVFHIARPRTVGWIEADVAITIECNGRIRTYHNDNHRTSSRRPLRIFLSEHSLATHHGLAWGEAHSHSSYTDDQVEFGCPIAPVKQLSAALGLKYFCVTDHSYDLDDRLDDFLVNDPTLPKWTQLQQEIDSLNAEQPSVVAVRGEEVSCRNSEGKNVHFLLYGTRKFFHGSGDSAEKLFRTWCENSIRDVLAGKERDTAAFGSHVKEQVPVSQKIVFNRSTWEDDDLRNDGLDGFQFANGKHDRGFQQGYRTWIRMLLEGRRLFTVAGNDAHGNFNRFRQLVIPFLLVREADEQLFGKMRTGVFVNDLNETAITGAIRSGHSLISDGPAANITVVGGARSTSIGAELNGNEFLFTVEAISTPEYGAIDSVIVYVGELHAPRERVLAEWKSEMRFSVSRELSVNVSKPGYVRVAVFTSDDNPFDRRPHFCFTNPVWLTPTT